MPQKSARKLPQRSRARTVPVADRPSENTFWIYALACVATIIVAFQVYSPALRGQFVFDDLFLTYTNPHAASLSLRQWCGLRPVLGLSFWANFQSAGLDTFPYHALNVLIHSFSTMLLFLIVRRLLEWAGTVGVTGRILAGFSAAFFLLHPVQTESVAYIASRSENLSLFFIFSGFCLFLYRRPKEMNWPVSMAIVCLFGLALGTKEHAIAFPAVLLLTDYFWTPGFQRGGIRRSWRLYLPMALMAAAGAAFVWTYVSRDGMIGFHIPGLSWYQYFFTECRAVFGYLSLFLFPVGLNVDHEFAESLTITDHGAIVAMVCLAGLIALGIYFRRRFPLACYGFFVFLLFLAPTSSFIPIHDVFVERRLYVPFIGLLLIVLEALRRLQVPPKALAVILACLCLVPGYLTWRRAGVWTSVTKLWENSVVTAPGKARPHIGLGNAYMHDNKCVEAVREYEVASGLGSSDSTLNYNLAAAYECTKQPARAIPLLVEAIAERPRAAPDYALLGMAKAETGDVRRGLEFLDRAQTLDPKYGPTHAYRGAILVSMGQAELGAKEYEICLQLDPTNLRAQRGLEKLNQDGSR